MPRYKSCCIRGCSTTNKQSETKLFTFPKFKDQCMAWVSFCNDPKLTEKFISGIKLDHTQSRICANHFSKVCFWPPRRDKIFRGVIPTLNPPLPLDFDDIKIKTELIDSTSPNPSPGNSFTSTHTSQPPPSSAVTSPFPGNSSSSPAKTLCLHPPDSGSPSPTPLSPFPGTSLASPAKTPPCLQPSDTCSSSPTPSTPYTDTSLPCPAKTPHFSPSDGGYKRIADCPSQTHIALRFAKLKEIKIQNMIAKFKRLKQELKGIENILGGEEEEIINFIHRKLSPSAISFINTHLRCAKRSPKGSLWTAKEKRMALALYKRSPKCYRLLCCMFALPSVRTLSLMLNNIPFTTGINPRVLKCISQSLYFLPDCNRLCSLLFGEMSIREHMDYSRMTDMILGFEDYGDLGRTGKPAKYALVFMIRGVLENWKQPIATYFSSNPTKADTLVVLIKKILHKCNVAGLRVICTICDMSSSNVKAIKGLGSTVQKPYFFHGGRQIITIFDPPHLLKYTRNLLISNDISVPVNTGSPAFERASWNDIKVVYHLDKQVELPFLRHLTDTHLNPIGKQKKRVDLAAQVFSYRVAAVMLHYIETNKIPNAALGTALFVKTMDAVFDSCNGDDENATPEKPLTYSMTEGSDHFLFWKDCISQMKKWKFVPKESEDTRRHSDSHQPPFQKGWVMNLRGFMLLWRIISHEKQIRKPVEKMPLRKFNKDPLENLFCAIRAQYRSNSPSVKQFISALKTYNVNGLATKAVLKGNCIPDSSYLLSDLGDFQKDRSRGAKEGSADDAVDVDDVYFIRAGCCLRSEDKDRDNTAIGTSFCDSVARTVLQKRNCEDCRAGIFMEASNDLSLGFRDQFFTNLSEIFVNSLRNMLSCIRNILNNIAHEERVVKTIFNRVKDEFSLTWLEDFCSKHVDEVKHDILLVLISYSVMIWMKEKKIENIHCRKEPSSTKVHPST